MTYPRLVALGFIALLAGCGGATRGNGNNNNNNNNNPPPEVDAAEPIQPPVKMDAAAPPLASDGEKCTTGSQCKSTYCIDGVCCDSDCRGACKKCNLPAALGQCTNVDDGEDPDNECPNDPASTCRRDGMCDGQGACRKFYAAGTECAAAKCSNMVESSNQTCDGNGMCQKPTTKMCGGPCVGMACPEPCGPANPCQAGLYCDPNMACKPKKANGLACMTGDECTSTACVDGVCCNSGCTGTCQACNLPGTVGTCVPVPLGQDPNTECPADLAAPCGRAGGCDGSGACRFREEGVPCSGGMTCSGTTESVRTCNGRGMCVSSNPRSCAPYRCAGIACGVTCVNSSECAPGNSCIQGACQGGNVQGDELLHWAFDETSNADLTAFDSSGNGNNGTYEGNAENVPTVSTNVPPTGGQGQQNLRSRTFDNAQREVVQLLAMPQSLRPTNDLTVTAWYRANTLDTAGADIVSAGDTYVLRLRTGSIEFSKRYVNANGTGAYTQCRVTVSGHLNNQWHHIAGVTTSAGMTLYFDGREVCSNQRGEDLLYDRGQNFYVGRHGNGETTWDFEGQIDDVRVFGRELTADDIRAMAGNTPGAADVVLHWRFDETSTTTTTAQDSSGNNYPGTYIGNNGNLPAPVQDAAPIGVNNPRSRVFDRDQREAVREQGMPSAIKPANDVTVSAWFKTTSVDTAGADIVSAGDNYFLRLRTGSVEFGKRTSTLPNGAGTRLFRDCRATVNNHLNGQWHHLVGVSSPDGMTLYMDGVEVCQNQEGNEIVYDQGNDLYVGRNGDGTDAAWDFEGNIDDVRIYGRALQAQEVQDLFGGMRPAELVINWRFDESSTTTQTAIDSSGSNLNGTYTGNVGMPSRDTQVPSVQFQNPYSRLFNRANRHAVRYANMPQSLRLNGDLTVSAWYRANTIEGTGSEIVSAGNSYLIRVRQGGVDFAKRIAGGYASCMGDFAQALDGQWHHIAGVTDNAGMRVYVDGAEVCNNARVEPIVYDQGQDFWVGRHGNTQTTWDFEGNIDDVRVYSRALDSNEITNLANGSM